LVYQKYYRRENYFENNRNFIEDNYLLKYIYHDLKKINKIFFGKSIEMIMRDVLMNYFENNSSDDHEKHLEIINLILNDYIINGCSLLDILYYEICDKIVYNSIEIYQSKNASYGSNLESIKDILINYFNLLNNFSEILSEDIMNIFIDNIASYFDVFITRTINLWLVNIENILRFFINNYRCLKTYEIFIKHFTNK
jgi:hypothetical protein